MSYQAVLGLHLVAVMLFVGGLLLVALLSRAAARGGDPLDAGELRRLTLWTWGVTTPALVGLWVAGLTLASWGGWWSAGWLHAKVACVAVLTAAYLDRAMRIGQRPRSRRDRLVARWFPLVAVVLAGAIVLLVTRKPG